MNVKYMTSSELKNHAKDLLDGRYGSSILIMSIGITVSVTLTMFASSFMNTLRLTFQLGTTVSQVFALLLDTAIKLFTNVFSVGYALFFLNMACRRRCDVSQLFYGFKWQFDKCLALSGFFALASLAYTLPFQLCLGMFAQTREMRWLMASLLAVCALLVAHTVFSLFFSQCYYLMLDFPDYTVRQLLQGSVQIMKGHKGRLFYLGMSFIPLTLLALLTCGVGVLWLGPYMHTTYACFFLDLMNPQKVPADAAQI